MGFFDSKDDDYKHGYEDGKKGGLSDDLLHDTIGTIIPGTEIYDKGYDQGRKDRDK